MDRTERSEESNKEGESNDSSTEPRLSDEDDDNLKREIEFVDSEEKISQLQVQKVAAKNMKNKSRVVTIMIKEQLILSPSPMRPNRLWRLLEQARRRAG
jgi:hypothetical protein